MQGTLTTFRWLRLVFVILSVGLAVFIIGFLREKESTEVTDAKSDGSHGQISGSGKRASDFIPGSILGDTRPIFQQRFHRWHTAFLATVPDADPLLKPGMSAEEMDALDKHAGNVPLDLRRLLLRHNGQDQDGTPIYWVYRLLSSEEIATEDDELSAINAAYGISEAEKAGTIPVEEAVWWHPDLMLFLSDDNGGGIAVDRKTGTVWDWDHDGGLFGMLAPSIGIFFERMAIAFEDKRFTIEDAGDLLWRPEINPKKEEQGTPD